MSTYYDIMGLINWLKRLLRVKSITNQSITPSYKEFPTSEYPLPPAELSEPSPSTIQLEKDSLQLGIAAGYTGRSIRDIDSSLNRIESQMVTKDWLAIKLEEAIKTHETHEEHRFQAIEATLSSLIRYFDSLPAQMRIETIKEALTSMQLTNKMQQLIKVVEGAGEISYADLALRLNISQDALRGLLSRVVRRTNQIQRVERRNKGWVRFISESNQNQSQINQESMDNTMQEGISDQ